MAHQNPNPKSKIPRPMVKKTQTQTSKVISCKTRHYVADTKTKPSISRLRTVQQEVNTKSRDDSQRINTARTVKKTSPHVKKEICSQEGDSYSYKNAGQMFAAIDAKDQDQFKDEFKRDEKALESILSSKGITPDMPTASRPSAMMLQPMRMSSMYYQSPSQHVSLKDSHDLFKEKMKLLKEQMKSHNIKCEATPKGNRATTTSTTASSTSSSSRPTSIYYKIKPLEAKTPSTKDSTTPVAAREMPRYGSLSERKELQPRDLNHDRISQTAWKNNNNNPRHQHPPSSSSSTSSSRLGKENRCKFKLFSSPIHEIPDETTSSPNSVALLALQKSTTQPQLQPPPCSSSSSQSWVSSHSLSQPGGVLVSVSSGSEEDRGKELLSKESQGCASASIVNVNVTTDVPSSSSIIAKPSDATLSSLTPLAGTSSYVDNTMSSSSSKSVAIVSTPTLCTWARKDTIICTPVLEPLESTRNPTTTTGCDESTNTPVFPNSKRLDFNSKENVTPSRTPCKSEGLNKAPQRTPVAVAHNNKTPIGLSRLQVSKTWNQNTSHAPFLSSYLKSKLESGGN